jgi:hypothetical protein
MSDRSSASIDIGGKLAADKIDELADAIESEGVGLDWGEYLDAAGARAAIVDAFTSKGPLRLMANEVRGGAFESLESICRELGLTYCRGDDGRYTWTASLVYWEPGFAEPQEWNGTVDNHTPQLDAWKIRKLLGPQCDNIAALRAELDLMDKAEKFAIPLVIEGDIVEPADDEATAQ